MTHQARRGETRTVLLAFASIRRDSVRPCGASHEAKIRRFGNICRIDAVLSAATVILRAEGEKRKQPGTPSIKREH
jgi:hypothetical protein